MQGQSGHSLSSPMSSDKDDSNDGLGDIKKEPDLTGHQSVYTDLQKALPGGGIMPGLDMQSNGNNTHNSHHPVLGMNNGGHHPDMGHMLQEYQTL